MAEGREVGEGERVESNGDAESNGEVESNGGLTGTIVEERSSSGSVGFVESSKALDGICDIPLFRAGNNVRICRVAITSTEGDSYANRNTIYV